MGRTGSPRKPSPAARTLSSRLAHPLAFSPSPLSQSTLSSVSPSATPRPEHSSPMAPKRTIDEVAASATPKPLQSQTNKNKRQRQRKNKRDHIASNLGEPGESPGLEDGEVVEGDFSDLFMVDTTPAAVSKENRFAPDPPPAPASPTAAARDSADQAQMLVADEDDHAAAPGNATLDEQDIMKIFAKEVAMTDSDDDSQDSDDDEEEDESDDGADHSGINIEGAMLYDDEEGLKEAIQGKIVDDSSAPVAGRYYKEADLTKTCVLCGEHGHSSRDCTHSQCFICGQIDVEHEARNCPVSLVCSACGSRGHFARDCDIAPGHGRYGNNHRCSICQSNNHNSTNCSTRWRIYDTSGPKPQKRKVVCACANCGSTRDHFIDDCLLPRGHPMKYADPSAFNRDALGAAAASLPAYSAGGPTSAAASKRRNGGARSRRYDDDYDSAAGGGGAGDDDWFASRARTAAASGGGGGGGGGGKGGRDSARASSWKGNGKGAAGGGGGGTHIHFGGISDSSRDRFQQGPGGGGGSASSSRSYRDLDRPGSGYDSPRDSGASWKKSAYEGRKGSYERRPPPSLLDRVGSGGGGGSGSGGSRGSGGGSGRKPKYQGGYV
ncbi:hypothetical protein JCM11491_003322 [Sporobolomyces phaffii]